MNAAAATPPVDIATMRETIRRVIGPGAQPPTGEDLDTLTTALRGHMELLIPEVEQAARKLPRYYPPRDGALACVWSARHELSAAVDPGTDGVAAHSRDLAHALGSLCNRYEELRQEKSLGWQIDEELWAIDAAECSPCDDKVPDSH
ncbi:hypothetical protein RKD49_003577 [Streptomyces glaucescens]